MALFTFWRLLFRETIQNSINDQSLHYRSRSKLLQYWKKVYLLYSNCEFFIQIDSKNDTLSSEDNRISYGVPMDYKISSTNRLSGHLVDSFVKYSCDCAVKEDAYRTSDKKRFYSSLILQAFHSNVFFFFCINRTLGIGVFLHVGEKSL